jgi:hypothetical protein
VKLSMLVGYVPGRYVEREYVPPTQRQPVPKQATCLRGHPHIPENRTGHNSCRVCARDRLREWRAS